MPIFISWQRCYFGWLCLLFSTASLADDGAAEASTTQALSSYLQATLNVHPQLKAAEALLVAAQAQADALAQPVYNPALNLNGERAQSDSYSLGLTHTFDLSGKRTARRASGELQLQQVLAERAELRRQLAAGIMSALIEYQDKRAALRLAQQRWQLLQRFADIAEQQYRAGDIGVLDRNLASLAHAEAVAGLGRAELAQLQARRALNDATRQPGLGIPELPAAAPAPDNLATDYAALAQSLPAVRVALARQQSSLAQVMIARSNRRIDPTISLSGGRETSASEAGKALLGLQLTIPLFIANNFSAEQSAAAAQADAARIDAAALYQQALQQLEDSAEQYRAVFSAWQSWHAATENIIDNGIEVLNRVWLAHELSTAEYLLQLRQLLDGRATGAELQYQTWHAWSDWWTAGEQWQVGSPEVTTTAIYSSGSNHE